MKKWWISLPIIGIVAGTITYMIASKPALSDRKVDPEHYKNNFKTNPTTWIPQASQQAEDSKIGTHLYDGLITPNRYGKLEGALADWWGSNKTGSSWYFNIRDKEFSGDSGWFLDENGEYIKSTTKIPQWTKVDKFKVDKSYKKAIVPMDWYNTFRFGLNSLNTAEGVTVFTSFYKHSDILSGMFKQKPQIDQDGNPIKGTGSLIVEHPDLFDPYYKEAKNSKLQRQIATFANDIAIMVVNLHGDQIAEEYIKNDSQTTWEWMYQHYLAPGKDYDIMALIRDELKPNQETLPTNRYQNLIIKSSHEGQIIKIAGNQKFKAKPEGEASAGIEDQEYNLQINLSKDARAYFDSITSFLPFSPMHDNAVNYKDIAHSGLHFARQSSPDASSMYYSGAYIVSNYKTNQIIEMVVNPNYYQPDKQYVKKISLFSNLGAGIDKPRLLFEGGDISTVAIQSDDIAGWNKYVGPNANITTSEVYTSNLVSSAPKQATTTWATMYNVGKMDANNKVSTESKALAQDSVKTYISYLLNRSEIANIKSKSADNETNFKNVDGDRISKLERNTWMSKTLVSYNDGEKDIDYVDGSILTTYKEEMKTLSNQSGATEMSDDKSYYNHFYGTIADEHDALYKNDLLILKLLNNKGDEFSEEKEQIQLKIKETNEAYKIENENDRQNEINKLSKEKIQILDNIVAKDLSKKGIADVTSINPIKFGYILSGSGRTTTNPYFESAFTKFNNQSGVIKIFSDVTNDASDYTARMNKGQFDMLMSGWTPDFRDPSNYLETINSTGIYAGYSGFSRALKHTNEGLVTQDPNDEKFYEELIRNLNAYDEDLKKASDTLFGKKERYEEMGKIEYRMLFEYHLLAPVYAGFLPYEPTISYLNHFMRPQYPSGESENKVFGAKMFSKLTDFNYNEWNDKLKAIIKQQHPLNYNFKHELTWNESLYYSEI